MKKNITTMFLTGFLFISTYIQAMVPVESNLPANLIQLKAQHPDCELLNKLSENYDVFLDVYKSCNYQFWSGCGSYLFDGVSYAYCEKMYEKQKLFYETAKKCNNLLEVGVYMGHSIFIALLANPDLEITCIDIDDHYSGPALEVLSQKFNKKIDFIKGDSIVELPLIDKKFDMFHIDGHHTSYYLNAEFLQCLTKCSSEHVFFIVDDYDSYPNTINKLLKDNDVYTVVSFIIPPCSWCNIMIEILLQQ